MIKLVISGIAGKMGKRIGLLASDDKDFKITGALETAGNPTIGKDVGEVIGTGKTGIKVSSDLSEVSDGSVLIEFTSPQATIIHLGEAIKKNIAMVIGTTALGEEDIKIIKKASSKIPIVFSPNMSIGANLLFELAEEVAKKLNNNYEIEIIEAHHSQKKDAPSGTAKKLQESVFASRKKMPVVHSIRVGDIVGDHTVIFAGNAERIELTHRAHSRDNFAKGALDAAKYLSNKKTGLYDMRDVLSKT